MRNSATRRGGVSLGQAARTFWRFPSPWLLAGALGLAVAGRIAAGDWRLSDAVVPLALAAVFPFFEWMIHVLVLHWRPRRFAGIAVDPMLARKHREHHADPHDTALIFIPLQSLIGALVSATAVALLLFPRLGLGLTFLVLILGVGLAYEWTHYLVHTDYRPRSRIYRFIRRNHRLHHYKNEHYWFAVTTPGTADRVLGTYPAAGDVPTSPTARHLGAGPATT